MSFYEPGVSVVIPTHLGRDDRLLKRAIDSVLVQTLTPREILVVVDTQQEGAGATRQRGLELSTSEYTAFLDSDDEFLPDHLAVLHRVIEADEFCIMAYSWFEAVGMPDPLGHFGLPFDPARPHHTTSTTMVNTSVAKSCGGFPTQGEGSSVMCSNEDWIFLLRMCEVAVKTDMKIVHVPQKTWRYHGHSGNTSGKPRQGDAR